MRQGSNYNREINLNDKQAEEIPANLESQIPQDQMQQPVEEAPHRVFDMHFTPQYFLDEQQNRKNPDFVSDLPDWDNASINAIADVVQGRKDQHPDDWRYGDPGWMSDDPVYTEYIKPMETAWQTQQRQNQMIQAQRANEPEDIISKSERFSKAKVDKSEANFQNLGIVEKGINLATPGAAGTDVADAPAIAKYTQPFITSWMASGGTGKVAEYAALALKSPKAAVVGGVVKGLTFGYSYSKQEGWIKGNKAIDKAIELTDVLDEKSQQMQGAIAYGFEKAGGGDLSDGAKILENVGFFASHLGEILHYAFGSGKASTEYNPDVVGIVTGMTANMGATPLTGNLASRTVRSFMSLLSDDRYWLDRNEVTRNNLYLSGTHELDEELVGSNATMFWLDYGQYLYDHGVTDKDTLQYLIQTAITDVYGDLSNFSEFLEHEITDPSNVTENMEARAVKAYADITHDTNLATAAEHNMGTLAGDLTGGIPVIPDIVRGINKLAGRPDILKTSGGMNEILADWDIVNITEDPSNLTDLDRKFSGISEDNTISIRFTPNQHTAKSRIGKIVEGVRDFFSETNESRAAVEGDAIFDYINVGIEDAIRPRPGETQEDTIKRVRRFVDELQNPETISPDSPFYKTTKSVLFNSVKDDIAMAVRSHKEEINKAISQYADNITNRQTLYTLAEALGLTPQKVIDLYTNQKTVLAQMILDKADENGGKIPGIDIDVEGRDFGEQVMQRIAPFVGKDAQAWDVRQLVLQLSSSIADGVSETIVGKYEIAPDKFIYRFGDMIKKMQNLVLLGLSPSYLANNFVNNVVTRTALGYGGYMTPKTINEWMDRFGYTPERIKESMGREIGQESLNKSSNYEKLTLTIDEKKKVNDGIKKVGDFSAKVSRKFGIFGNLSNKIEAMESQQVLASAMMTYMRKTWKAGVNFRKMPASLEAAIEAQNPGMVETIYSAISGGINMDEIRSALFGTYVAPAVQDSLLQAAKNLGLPKADDIVYEYFVKNGMLDKLNEALKGKNIDEIDSVVRDIAKGLKELLEVDISKDITSRAETVAKQTGSEGWVSSLNIALDVSDSLLDIWLNSQDQNTRMFQRRIEEGMSPKEFHALYSQHQKNMTAQWKNVYAKAEQAWLGILKGMGLKDKHIQTFLVKMHEKNQMWLDFFENVQPKYFQEYLEASAWKPEYEKNPKLWDAKAKKAWKTYVMKTSRKVKSLHKHEAELQVKMDKAFCDSLKLALGTSRAGDIDSKIAPQMEAIRNKRQEIIDKSNEARAIADNTNVLNEKNTAWHDVEEELKQLRTQYYDMQNQLYSDIQSYNPFATSDPSTPITEDVNYEERVRIDVAEDKAEDDRKVAEAYSEKKTNEQLEGKKPTRTAEEVRKELEDLKKTLNENLEADKKDRSPEAEKLTPEQLSESIERRHKIAEDENKAWQLQKELEALEALEEEETHTPDTWKEELRRDNARDIARNAGATPDAADAFARFLGACAKASEFNNKGKDFYKDVLGLTIERVDEDRTVEVAGADGKMYQVETIDETHLNRGDDNFSAWAMNEDNGYNPQFLWAFDDSYDKGLQSRTLPSLSEEAKNNGEIIKWYHGTSETFDSFNLNRVGRTGHSEGTGFYLTPHKDIAERYHSRHNGKEGNVYELVTNVSKPLDTSPGTEVDYNVVNAMADIIMDTLTPEELDALRRVDKLSYNDTFYGDYASAYYRYEQGIYPFYDTYTGSELIHNALVSYLSGSGSASNGDAINAFCAIMSGDYKYGGRDAIAHRLGEVTPEIQEEIGNKRLEALRELHKATGYDSTYSYSPEGKEHYYGDGDMILVVWFPENVKAVTNEGEWSRESGNFYHQEELNQVDSVTRADVNTPEFKEWHGDHPENFKPDGTPLTVWHGSDSIFTEFDNRYLGANTHAPSAKLGIFTTSTKKNAENYVRGGKNSINKNELILAQVYDLPNLRKDYDKPLISYYKAPFDIYDLKEFLPKVREIQKKVNEAFPTLKDDTSLVDIANSIEERLSKLDSEIFHTQSIPEWVNTPLNRAMLSDEEFDVAREVRYLNAEINILREASETAELSIPNKDAINQSIEELISISDPNPYVREFYLSFKNPYVIDYEGKRRNEIKPFSQAVREAIDGGYDAVILKNTYDPDLADMYVVFEPEQIKSVYNRGEFSRDTANLYHQIEEADNTKSKTITIDGLTDADVEAMSRPGAFDLYDYDVLEIFSEEGESEETKHKKEANKLVQQGLFDRLVTGEIDAFTISPSEGIEYYYTRPFVDGVLARKTSFVDGKPTGHVDYYSYEDYRSDSSSLFRGREVKYYTDISLYQNENRRIKGQFRIQDGQKIVSLFRGSDFSTLIHETFGHGFSTTLNDAQAEALAAYNGWTLEKYRHLENQFYYEPDSMSEKDRQDWIDAQERFAYGFEQYLMEGKAPNNAMRQVFEAFRRFLLEIYKGVRHLVYKGEEINIHKRVNGVTLAEIFDSMLDGYQGQPQTQFNIDRTNLTGIEGQSFVAEDQSFGSVINDANREFFESESDKQWKKYNALKEAAEKKLKDDCAEYVTDIESEYGLSIEESSELIVEIMHGLGLNLELQENEWLKNSLETKTNGRRRTIANEFIANHRADAVKISDEAVRKFMDDISTDPEYFDEWKALYAYYPQTDENESAAVKARKEWAQKVFAEGEFAPLDLIDLPSIEPVGNRDKLLMTMARKLYDIDEADKTVTPDKKYSLEEWIKYVFNTSERQLISKQQNAEMDGILRSIDKDGKMIAELANLRSGSRHLGIPPQSRDYVAQTYTFDHGGNDIVAMVYHDGEEIAYVPNEFPITEIHDGDETYKVIGLAPNDPELLVYMVDGNIRTMKKRDEPTGNPHNPEMEFNSMPETDPLPEAHAQMAYEEILPIIEEFIRIYKKKLSDSMSQYKMSSLGEKTRADLQAYIERDVRQDLMNTKYKTGKFGEMVRDAALLNYNKRYGFDNFLTLLCPYQFWMTRSFKRWIDRMGSKGGKMWRKYYKLKELEKRNKKEFMPSKISGKFGIYIPGLPDWMGDAIFMSTDQLFVVNQFIDPILNYGKNKNAVIATAEKFLQEAYENGDITYAQWQAAMNADTREQSADWREALAKAKLEDSSDQGFGGLVGNYLGLNLPLSISKALITGDPTKWSQFPMSKTGTAFRAVVGDNWIGKLGEKVLSAPERALRKAAVSAFGNAFEYNEFGAFGDYYLRNQVFDMVTEGKISANDAVQACIQKDGNKIWEEAANRQREEILVRMQSGSVLDATKKLISDIRAGDNKEDTIGADWMYLLASILTAPMSKTVVHESEKQWRKERGELSEAYEAKAEGDKEAVNTYYDEHPNATYNNLRYEGDPEVMLRQYLYKSIMDTWFDLDKAEQSQITMSFGPDFQKDVINKETRAIEAMDLNRLAAYAQALNGKIPFLATDNLSTLNTPQIPIMQVPQTTLDQYNAYLDLREKQFPGMVKVNQIYWDLPAEERKRFIQSHPDLKKYQDWDKQYKTDHPEIKQYSSMISKYYDLGEMEDACAMLDSTTMKYLTIAAYSGNKLDDAFKPVIERVMDRVGTTDSYNDFTKSLMKYILGQ